MAHILPRAEDDSDGSESALSIQEVVINDGDTVTLFPDGPNNATSSLPRPATSSQFFLIPQTDYAPAYSSPFLINLHENYPLKEGVKLEHLFEHLNCFQLTPFFADEGPTLNSLKQHAAAVCCLIYYLHQTKDGTSPQRPEWPVVAADLEFFGAFDFLNNVVHQPFPEDGLSGDPQHSQPLAQLLNSITSDHPGLGELSHNEAQLVHETENLLTRLDEIYRDTGGLQSIPLPPPHSSMRESLLARWIEYVQRLKQRLISLQSESIALRQALSHEAVIPNVRSKSTARPTKNKSKNEKVIPQDGYIFTGLSEELHTVLRQQLNLTEAEAEDWAHVLPKEGSRGIFARGWGDFYLDGSAGGSVFNEDRQWDVKAWIETSSRLYKVRGHDTIFVIPAFGIHPDARAIDEHDLRVLDQLYPDPKKRKKMETERKEAQDKIKALEKSVERLRSQLRSEKRLTARQGKIADMEAKVAAKGNRVGKDKNASLRSGAWEQRGNVEAII